ncbi:MAG: acetate--CoA ligase family protein [Nocardia sp.]|nr:acetate--CoA ligase family protein [Nocardia sp.]
MTSVSAPPRSALGRMLEPRAIAVVGASANPAKRGHQILRSLRDTGYHHPVYPVHPAGGELLGFEVITEVRHLPPQVDIAVIALPANLVAAAVRQCADAGVAGVVVLANGFAESNERARNEELAAVIAETGIRVIGPNTSGLVNVGCGADLIGLTRMPAGPISLITQSGNMLLTMVNEIGDLAGPGFDICVGLGNQVDVRYDECLTEVANRPETAVVAVHAEGFTDGREFLIAAAEVTRSTPVVLVRGGRSELGARAVSSHTGAIASADAVTQAVLRQVGIEVVDRSDELAVVTAALAGSAPIVPGRGVVILSDGGGHAALAADALALRGVPAAGLTEVTRHRLRALLGPAAAVTGPVDVAGATDTDPMVFIRAVETLMDDPAVGLVLMVGMFGGYHLRFDPALAAVENRAADRLVRLREQHGIPVVVHSCFAGRRLGNHDRLRAAGVPVLSSIDHAARVVAALRRSGQRSAGSLRLPAPAEPIAGSGVLSEPLARELLQRAGIELGPWQFATSCGEVAAAALYFDGPCAVKVVSQQVIHKSDAGGVRLGVWPEEAAGAAAEIAEAVSEAVPDVLVDGYLVAPMTEAGIELLIGATQDPIFGPVVAFGSGGMLVEALAEVSFRAAPFTIADAHDLIEETKVGPMLEGFRSLPPVDRDALARLLVRIGDFVAVHPEIAELDLNPVIARYSSLTPVDVRLVVSAGSGE